MNFREQLKPLVLSPKTSWVILPSNNLDENQKKITPIKQGNPYETLFQKKQNQVSNIPIVTTNIRPSTAFISVPRENVSQTKFFDESKGPSMLLKR